MALTLDLRPEIEAILAEQAARDGVALAEYVNRLLEARVRFDAARRALAGDSRADPAVVRFRKAVGDTYGSRLERVVLFGSRARGDARPDSDYDIAVFIHDPGSFGEEAQRLGSIATDILLDTGEVINPLHFPAGAYNDRTGLMSELRRDAIDL